MNESHHSVIHQAPPVYLLNKEAQTGEAQTGEAQTGEVVSKAELIQAHSEDKSEKAIEENEKHEQK